MNRALSRLKSRRALSTSPSAATVGSYALDAGAPGDGGADEGGPCGLTLLGPTRSLISREAAARIAVPTPRSRGTRLPQPQLPTPSDAPPQEARVDSVVLRGSD